MATANHLYKSRTFFLSFHHNSFTPILRFPPFSLSPNPNPNPNPNFKPHILSISSTSNHHRNRRHCTTTTATAAVESAPDMAAVKEAAGLLDIRVGKVVKAWRHPDAESLYVEEVDVGDDEPRTICSGLVNFLSIDCLQDKKVIVLANLKPRNMRGIKSKGMLMAASDSSHENVELLVPPEDSVPGERIWFGSENDKESQPPAASPNQIQKKRCGNQFSPI